jgi:hypothetical protein
MDSGASNHMTNTIVPLSNVRNYDGNLKINTPDGSSLPINVVGDLSPSLTEFFLSPDLSTNLIFVGQLVDNNCDVHFFHYGCVVQDQTSRKMIVEGHKVGRLFPLHVSHSTSISSFPLLFFICNFIGSENKRWHKRLGHPNSDVLCNLINYGLLGNKTCSSLDLSFDCTSCKLGKSKVFLFLIMYHVPLNVLILFIMMSGGLHLLFLMLITNTLLLSLMTLVILRGFTSFELRLKFFFSF